MNDRIQPEAVCNVAVIRGAVHGEPTVRELPAGGIVAQFDVTTTIRSDGRATSVSVPIAWSEPSASDLGIVAPGTEVVVIGTVRRRFFRVGGATQSRTEVVADAVLPTRRHKQLATALGEVAARLAG